MTSDKNLIALPDTSQIMQTKVLLDECVTDELGKYRTLQSEVIACSIKLVGRGAKDPEIMQFAKINGYMLVTIDQKLVTRCIRHSVPVAYYINGRAHVLAVSQVFEIPTKTAGAPIKVKKAKRKRNQSLLHRLKNALSIKK